MDRMWCVGVVLAALEQVPGDPSDLTRVLRSRDDRHALLGGEGGAVEDMLSAATSPYLAPRSPLGRYLVEHLDLGRVDKWVKVVAQGVNSGRYAPSLCGWAGYPVRLRSTWDAPPILFRGLSEHHYHQECDMVAIDDADQPALAIVGGREVPTEILMATSEVAAAVAEEGVRVVSGLAAGVDAAAHQATLEAGGITTAVMGTGIDHIFPEENWRLAQEIAYRGVLLSQFAPPAPRTGTTFLRRNRVIAALSDASLMMGGRTRSGSRHEVEQAISYGKPVYLWRPALEEAIWARMLVRDGLASFVDSADDVVSGLRGW